MNKNWYWSRLQTMALRQQPCQLYYWYKDVVVVTNSRYKWILRVYFTLLKICRINFNPKTINTQYNTGTGFYTVLQSFRPYNSNVILIHYFPFSFTIIQEKSNIYVSFTVYKSCYNVHHFTNTDRKMKW